MNTQIRAALPVHSKTAIFLALAVAFSITLGTASAASQYGAPANTVLCTIYSVYTNVITGAFVLAIMLLLLGAAIYAGSHIIPSQARANVQGYGMGMVMGGIAGVIIVVVSPMMLSVASNGSSTSNITEVANFCASGGTGTLTAQLQAGPATGGAAATTTIPQTAAQSNASVPVHISTGGAGVQNVETVTVVNSLYGLSSTTLMVRTISTIKFSGVTNSSSAYGSISSPYDTDAGWKRPGYYYFPEYGNAETAQPVSTVADLDVYNLLLAGTNLAGPYYNASVVSGCPYAWC